MRQIEIRRHAYTKRGAARGRGSHLSAEGVALARAVSKETGSFALVLTSEVPRTLETAIAMGYAVDDILTIPADLGTAAMAVIGHHERWTWDRPWVRFAALVRQPGPVADLGTWLCTAWENALASIPGDGRVLVISHGRIIEVGVMACLPGLPAADLATWGEPLQHCEGVEMSYGNGRFDHPRVIRTRHATTGGL